MSFFSFMGLLQMPHWRQIPQAVNDILGITYCFIAEHSFGEVPNQHFIGCFKILRIV